MSLRVEGLRLSYRGSPLLRGVDLEVADGESGFLLGPSGSGKTSLLRAIAGLEEPEGGRVLRDGAPLDGIPPHRRGVGLLAQEPALFPHLDAAGNVAFGLRYRGVARADEPAEAARWLRLVRLEGKARSRVDELSGGERQRVALARTLAARPRVVLLDEPFSALDRALRDELGAAVKRLLAEQRVAALWVTHDEEEARRLGDRVWRLADGRAVALQ
ncbi:MAG TPA: ABC transporter ATP-binding protein [Candidatus Thermoplasmatota archaeon]|nr:ABC transporter ATP-binding protein [Candidatus Thermoplasmatota archaeon]